MKKTKHGDYEKMVTFPVFSKYRVHLIFAKDIHKSLDVRYGDTSRHGDADAFCRHSKDGHTHIFMPFGVTDNTIAHECWHAVFEMFDYVAAGLDNESVAYHLGYLVEQVYDFKRKVQHVSKN